MFDDIEKELGVYPEVSREELKEFKQQEFNKKQKTLRKTVGENMASFGCILVVILFVGYIWTDMKIDIFSQRMLCDALVSVVSLARIPPAPALPNTELPPPPKITPIPSRPDWRRTSTTRMTQTIT